MSIDFVHLHLHTEYSLTDSIVKIDSLMDAVSELGMSAVAITDHGTLAGVQKFSVHAKKRGIKPIIGCELYVEGEGRKRHHLTVLAKNRNGYSSVVRAMNAVSRDRRNSLKDEEILEMEDVVVLSGCIGGKIPSYILGDDVVSARALLERYRSRFGEDFYLELMDTGLSEQKKLNEILVSLAGQYGVRTVATNDVHFLRREDAKSHGLFVSMGRNMKWKGDFAYGSDQYYLKSGQEMAQIFPGFPEALETTLEIAGKCSDYSIAPELELPETGSCADLRGGIKIDSLGDTEKDRAERELKVIESKNFCGYFLLVSDIVKIAKEMGILIGPGRGSVVSSMVSYLLGITTVNPLDYDLIFERFLNEARSGDPDIDIDVEDTERGRLIAGIVEKYGIDRIAQVGAYGTLGTRAVVRSVGKAMNLNDRVIDDIAWRVSGYASVRDALTNNRELARMSRDPIMGQVLEYSAKLEGLAHHRTIHAAGIVMSDLALLDRVPMVFNEENWITEFDMEALANLGVIKIDILGLKTLSNIKETLGGDATRETLEEIPVDDPKIYELLRRGETLGIFQLESTSATSVTKKLSPKKFEDIVVLLGLNRPGPMYSGMADEYIKRSHGVSSSVIDEFGLNDLLGETHGMILYQEQIMEIARKLAGFTMVRADIFRKAVSKKDTELMNELRGEFVRGCSENGTEAGKAVKLFEMIQNFASYGFNKSHSVAYAYITAWTAYLKAEKPAQYLVSLMNSNISNSAKLSLYAKEAKRLNVDVLQPDVNVSGSLFSVDNGAIRVGLAAIKGVGLIFGDSVKKEREKGAFKDLQDFLSRMKKSKPSRKVTEALILSGALDSACENRRYALENLEMIADISDGGLKSIQQQLFGAGGAAKLPSPDGYPDYELTEKVRLQKQYIDLGAFELAGDGFSKVMETGRGKVAFYILDDNSAATTATDGGTEVEISSSGSLPAGGPYEGEFVYRNGSMTLLKLLGTPSKTYIYIENAEDAEKLGSMLIDAPGRSVVVKFKDISIVIEEKTLKEEVL